MRGALLLDVLCNLLEARFEDVVACDVGLVLGDLQLALFALLVDGALLPSVRPSELDARTGALEGGERVPDERFVVYIRMALDVGVV